MDFLVFECTCILLVNIFVLQKIHKPTYKQNLANWKSIYLNFLRIFFSTFYINYKYVGIKYLIVFFFCALIVIANYLFWILCKYNVYILIYILIKYFFQKYIDSFFIGTIVVNIILHLSFK